MTTQMIVRIDSDIKAKFQRLSRLEQKSANEKIRDLIEDYVKEHDIEAAMKGIWSEIGKSLKNKGYKASDVKKAVSRVRSGK